MGEITFIRHGQASFGRGDYDVLSDTGREQCLALACYLMNCGAAYDAAYSGTLNRQMDTADLVLEFFRGTKSLKVPWLRRLEGLCEYQSDSIMHHYVPLVVAEDSSLVPLLEKIYTDKRSFQVIFEKVMAKWLAGESLSHEVESWAGFRQRVMESINAIIAENVKGSRVVVFTSGGVTSAAVQIATGMSPYEAIRMGWGLVNTSFTKFRYGSSGLILHSFNSYPHLDLGKTKDLITYR